MYLARKRIKGKLHYYIRETFQAQEGLKSREILELSDNPADYIIYPGGRSFYIREDLAEDLNQAGAVTNQEELEEIFWPFLKDDIKRVQEPYRSRGKMKLRKKLTVNEQKALTRHTHLFDKRRIHYLRFKRIDQGYIGRIPGILLRKLQGKSRDEIEQYFIRNEQTYLRSHERKMYIYVIFDLQHFFSSMTAKLAPEALDQDLMDDYFIEELCRLNRSDDFRLPAPENNSLHEYLIRYLIMYFDNDFEKHNVLHDYVQDFINSHKAFRGYPKQGSVSISEASSIFDVAEEHLNNIDKNGLNRLYRSLARRYHPDLGGEHEKFIRLTEAYESLMKKRGFTS